MNVCYIIIKLSVHYWLTTNMYGDDLTRVLCLSVLISNGGITVGFHNISFDNKVLENLPTITVVTVSNLIIQIMNNHD